MKKIKLAIADDHSLFLQTLVYSIQQDEKWKGIEIVLQAGNGKDLIEKLKENAPDVILMDLEMPEMDGIEATVYIRDHYPDIKTIILSMHNEKKFIIELIRMGASAYLFKDAKLDELRIAIETVAQKGFYFNDWMSEAMFKGWAYEKKLGPDVQLIMNFKKRELEILKLICSEYTTADIAKKLSLSPRTVDGYRERLMDKTGTKNTAGLAVYALINELIPLDLLKSR